jgi:hypothetical protein
MKMKVKGKKQGMKRKGNTLWARPAEQNGQVMVLTALFVALLFIPLSMVIFDLGVLVSAKREAQLLSDLASAYGARQLDKSKAAEADPKVAFQSTLEAKIREFLTEQMKIKYGEDGPYSVTRLQVSSNPRAGNFIPLDDVVSRPHNYYVEVKLELEIKREATLLLDTVLGNRKVSASSRAILALGES